MTIEVRQLLIRSQVGVRAPVSAQVAASTAARELERAKAQILAECKAWMLAQIQAARER